MKKRSFKSTSEQILRISEAYPNHRLMSLAIKSYFSACERIANILKIRKILDNINGVESWYYDRNEFYSNWDTEISMEAR